MNNEKLYIDVIDLYESMERIDQLCKRFGMEWTLEYRPNGSTAVYSLDLEFPVHEIEHEWWFGGYDLKED